MSRERPRHTTLFPGGDLWFRPNSRRTVPAWSEGGECLSCTRRSRTAISTSVKANWLGACRRTGCAEDRNQFHGPLRGSEPGLLSVWQPPLGLWNTSFFQCRRASAASRPVRAGSPSVATRGWLAPITPSIRRFLPIAGAEEPSAEEDAQNADYPREILNDCVLPFFDGHGVALSRVVTDQGTQDRARRVFTGVDCLEALPPKASTACPSSGYLNFRA